MTGYVFPHGGLLPNVALSEIPNVSPVFHGQWVERDLFLDVSYLERTVNREPGVPVLQT